MLDQLRAALLLSGRVDIVRSTGDLGSSALGGSFLLRMRPPYTEADFVSWFAKPAHQRAWNQLPGQPVLDVRTSKEFLTHIENGMRSLRYAFLLEVACEAAEPLEDLIAYWVKRSEDDHDARAKTAHPLAPREEEERVPVTPSRAPTSKAPRLVTNERYPGIGLLAMPDKEVVRPLAHVNVQDRNAPTLLPSQNPSNPVRIGAHAKEIPWGE